MLLFVVARDRFTRTLGTTHINATAALRCLKRLRRLASTITPCPAPPCCVGFLAGLHSHGPDAEYDDFDIAYETLCDVPINLLRSFEEELKMNQMRVFVHGDKEVSVIDSEDEDVTTRTLILNRRPHLVQTAIRISSPFAKYSYSGPSPLSETHFPGLALALLMCPDANPRCAVIGAGGCELPNTLATFNPSSLVAVEPSEEVRNAAALFFGADASKYELVGSDGESFLSSQPSSSLDLLIVDADDGNIPPKSMRAYSFFTDLVIPALSDNGVMAINAVGSVDEISTLEGTIRASFPNHSTARLPAPREAGVNSERHVLLFVTPSPIIPEELSANLIKRPVVSSPKLWIEQIERTL